MVANILTPDSSPGTSGAILLSSTRTAVGVLIEHIPQGARTGLLFFFLMFVLRVVLRNQWLAAGVFTFIFSAYKYVGGGNHALLDGGVSIVIFGLAAFVVLRYGMLSLATGVFLTDLLFSLPLSGNPGVWYIANSMVIIGVVTAFAAWALYVAIGGRTRVLN